MRVCAYEQEYHKKYVYECENQILKGGLIVIIRISKPEASYDTEIP